MHRDIFNFILGNFASSLCIRSWLKTWNFQGFRFCYLLEVKMWLTKILQVALGFVKKISHGHPYHLYIGRIPGQPATLVAIQGNSFPYSDSFPLYSLSTVSKALRYRMSEKLSRKKLVRFTQDKYSVDSLNYYQDFIRFMSRVDPYRIKFRDEASFALSDCALEKYGHSPAGEKCIEISRHVAGPKVSLLLLIGMDGIPCQSSKSDGIQGFEFGNQRLATTVHRAFEFKKHIRISSIECNFVSYCRTQHITCYNILLQGNLNIAPM